MKIEKIAAGVLGLLVAVFFIIYFTLPEQGEQIYIPQETSVPEEIEIPEGYQRVDNYSDVYYTETEDGYRYLWLVQFSDGSYGWQEVDENGNLIFPNRGTEEAPSEEASPGGRNGGKLAGQFGKCGNGTGVRVIFLISRLPEVNLSPA